jgi:hypothetical protein
LVFRCGAFTTSSGRWGDFEIGGATLDSSPWPLRLVAPRLRTGELVLRFERVQALFAECSNADHQVRIGQDLATLAADGLRVVVRGREYLLALAPLSGRVNRLSFCVPSAQGIYQHMLQAHR